MNNKGANYSIKNQKQKLISKYQKAMKQSVKSSTKSKTKNA